MKKACNHESGTCLAYAVEGHARCADHLKDLQTKGNKRRRKVLGSGAARRLRDEINTMEAIVCVSCRGTFPPSAIEIDHIIPLIDGGFDFIEQCQTLCSSCHQQKTAAEAAARAARRRESD